MRHGHTGRETSRTSRHPQTGWDTLGPDTPCMVYAETGLGHTTMVGHSCITPIHPLDNLRISQSVYGCKNVLSVCLGYFHYIPGFESCTPAIGTSQLCFYSATCVHMCAVTAVTYAMQAISARVQTLEEFLIEVQVVQNILPQITLFYYMLSRSSSAL